MTSSNDIESLMKICRRYEELVTSLCQSKQWFLYLGSWNIFEGVASRYFMYTAILHLLYSSFRWRRWYV